MKSASRIRVFVILCILIFSGNAMAQDEVYPVTANVDAPEIPGKNLDIGTNELGIWMGYSSDNPTLMGRTTNRPYLEADVQYARVLKTSNNWALKYTAEIVPLAIVWQPRQGFVTNGNELEAVDLPGNKQKIYGAGITPVGLQMNFRRGCILQPYINGTAGVLYFADQVPVADSSKFNFTLGLGGGIEIWYTENQSILLGYKYHHISNGYTARQNPGVDSDLFYVGYAWSWRQ